MEEIVQHAGGGAGEVGALRRGGGGVGTVALFRRDDGHHGVREHVQHGAEHTRIEEGDHLALLEEPFALARGALEHALEVRGEPVADAVHRADAHVDGLTRGLGGDEPLGVALGTALVGGVCLGGGDGLGLGDVEWTRA